MEKPWVTRENCEKIEVLFRTHAKITRTRAPEGRVSIFSIVLQHYYSVLPGVGSYVTPDPTEADHGNDKRKATQGVAVDNFQAAESSPFMRLFLFYRVLVYCVRIGIALRSPDV